MQTCLRQTSTNVKPYFSEGRSLLGKSFEDYLRKANMDLNPIIFLLFFAGGGGGVTWGIHDSGVALRCCRAKALEPGKLAPFSA